MYCWNCGQEADKNARFCTNCGVELRTSAAESTEPSPRPAAQPEETVSAEPRTYEPAPAVQSAPKKKNYGWIVVVAVIAVLMFIGLNNRPKDKSSGSSDPSSQNTDADAIIDDMSEAQEDLVKLHKVFVSDEDEGIRIFEIVFYGSDTHILTDITDEYILDKSYGYTMEDISEAGLEDEFPSFAEISYAEDDEYVIFICKMKDLKDVSRLQALVDYDFLTLTDGDCATKSLDADSYMDSVLALGWEEASMQDYNLLDFN